MKSHAYSVYDHRPQAFLFPPLLFCSNRRSRGAPMPSLPRSLPRLCVALGLPTASQLSCAAELDYKDGSTFLEFRLDYLPDPQSGVDLIRNFRKKTPDIHVLATCRPKQNKGHFSDSTRTRVQSSKPPASGRGGLGCGK